MALTAGNSTLASVFLKKKNRTPSRKTLLPIAADDFSVDKNILMTKLLFILFTLLVGQIFAQKADTSKVGFIFGCSCCADTLKDNTDKSWLYILSDNEMTLTAYKSGKKKWATTAEKVFGTNNRKINCMEFYEVKKNIVLRLFTSEIEQVRVDINPKNGHQISKILH